METRSRGRKNASTQTEVPSKKMKKGEESVVAHRVIVTRTMTAEEEEEEARQMEIRIQQMEAQIERMLKSYETIFKQYLEALIGIQMAIEEMEGRIPDPNQQMTEIPSLVDQFLQEYSEMMAKLRELLEASGKLLPDLNAVNKEEENSRICEMGTLGFKKIIKNEMDRFQNALQELNFMLPSH